MTRESSASRAPRRAVRRRGRVATWIPIAFLVPLLGLFGWSAYDLYLAPAVDPAASAQQVAALRQSWDAGPRDPLLAAPGEAVAILRIPALGGREYPVLVGTSDDVLALGVGWYEGTAAPGEVGNFAVAGHRGLSGPLSRLDELPAGAEIVVETQAATHTYVLDSAPGLTRVAASDTWVVQPVPGEPELRPTRALITLTTAGDLVASDARLVATGPLADTRPK